MNATRLLIPAIVMTATLTGCGHEPAETTPLDLAPITAKVASIEFVTDQKPIEVYGIVQPARQSFVSSRVIGPVVAVRIQAGDTVRKGQALVEILPQTINGQVAQAQGAQAQAEAALALAQKNFTRFANLHEQNAASDLELDMARMQFEQAKGAVAQAQGAVQSASSIADEAIVKSPFPARVVDKMIEIGDLAAPGRPLVRLESLSGRKVWLTIREADIGRITMGQELMLRFDTRADLGDVTGFVDEIVSAADPATHTFTVKVSLGNLDVASGIAARALLPGDEISRLAVPASAVFYRGGLELVVVRNQDGTARTRAVTTGSPIAGDRIEILSGLSENDQIVIDAPGPVADGTPVEVAS
ncbi:MAG: hypothetical protein DRJ65_03385 [Acidobacteria bacterium]|nr:MAG: hypothetical protein DRJ65_03385 [Acidobacteriota bacterium]